MVRSSLKVIVTGPELFTVTVLPVSTFVYWLTTCPGIMILTISPDVSVNVVLHLSVHEIVRDDWERAEPNETQVHLRRDRLTCRRECARRGGRGHGCSRDGDHGDTSSNHRILSQNSVATSDIGLRTGGKGPDGSGCVEIL